MPDFYGRKTNDFFNPQRRGMTDAEKGLLPYVKNEQAKQNTEFSWMQPLELVMDILSRGQYATANLGEDIARAAGGEQVNPLEGLWKGITGERKGSWKTTLFGGKDKGEDSEFKGIFSDTPEWMRSKVDIPIIGPTNVQDLIGFLGDVFLDPTTYISFGSTKVAKSVANDFAERSVKLAIKNLDDIGDLTKLYQKGLDKIKLNKLIATNIDTASKYVNKFDKNGGVAKFLDKVYRQSYDKALRTTPEQLKSELIEKLTQSKNTVLGNMFEDPQDIVKGIPFLTGIKNNNSIEKFTKAVGEKTATLFDKFQSFDSAITNLDSVNWKGAGETAFNLFGKESLIKNRSENFISKSWNTFKEGIEKSNIKGIYDDAVWSITNHGPVGWIRKVLGFRNPYQKLLNVKKNAAVNSFQVMAELKVNEADNILKAVDKETEKKVFNIIAEAEFKNIKDINMLFNNKDALKLLNIDEKEVNKIRFITDKVQEYFNDIKKSEKSLVDEGLMQSSGDFINYLPSIKNKKNIVNANTTNPLGSKSPWFTKEKKYLTKQNIAQETEKMSLFLGISQEDAYKLVTEKNWSIYNMDLKEMMMHRGIAHAQAVSNANMLRQFKEFGIKIDDIDPITLKENPHIIQALSRADADLSKVGLYRANNAVLSNYWFDKDVADIINRSINVNSSDEGIAWFLEKARAFTSWWKGMATLTPGFHLRNAQSNNTQLFLKFGTRAFNPKQSMDALIGTAYALHGEEIFKKLKIPEPLVKRTLEKRIGDKSIRELAMEAKKSGVISRNIMGFDVETTVKGLASKEKNIKGLNIFSNENIAFKGSRAVGEVVEATPKFQSMLMDLQDMAERVGNIGANHIEYAMLEAKKWFFDYGDLTEFEKKYLKTIVPFYTWIRKNIALQLTNIARIKSTVRSMYSIGFKAQGMISEDYDQSQLPDWMREAGYMVTGQEGDAVRTLASLPGISFPGPISDLNKLPFRFNVNELGIPIPVYTPEEVRDEILSSANPVIKSIVNVYLNQDEGWDSFKKRALKDTEQAPRVLSLFLDKPVVMQFVDGVLRMAGFKDGLQAERGENGELLIDGKVKKVLEDNFIVIQRLDNLLDTATTFIPQLETWLEKNAGYKDTADEMDKFFKTMSFLFGIKEKDFSKDQEEEIRIRDIMEKAQAKRNKDLKKTPGYKKRRAKYEKAYQRKVRRLGL